MASRLRAKRKQREIETQYEYSLTAGTATDLMLPLEGATHYLKIGPPRSTVATNGSSMFNKEGTEGDLAQGRNLPPMLRTARPRITIGNSEVLPAAGKAPSEGIKSNQAEVEALQTSCYGDHRQCLSSSRSG